MYLKSLTLKGFKSFADPTTIELEPGVTVVVGPNGSGKSNVVDAVAWVLGAQGPRVVRSQKMDDVIFAGTQRRSALGRAEVSLTIDNSSRRLPIDFNEVTITRTLFRTGESEYQLNGTPCRLLDVQELLSDTGVGRQQHVIVGQGQLDAVLAARPEDRRMVIEEAAGVLKYRRRRERSERRLEASEAALSRLQDLLREVRRQLKPLERQASSALRHEEIAKESDALRLYLTGRELSELVDRLGAIRAEIGGLEDRSSAHLHTLEGLDATVTSLQAELDANRTEDLAPIHARFVQLEERARGFAAFVAERRRSRAELASVQDDADALLAMEAELRAVRVEREETERTSEALVPESDELAAAEQAHAEAEAAHVDRFGITEAAVPDAALSATRAEIARVQTDLAARREAAARREERIGALDRQLLSATERRDGAEVALAAARTLAANEQGAHARAEEVAEAARRALEEREAAFVGAEEALRTARARVERLEGALEHRAASVDPTVSGSTLGRLGDLVTVDDRFAIALEAALEGVLDALVARDDEEARRALEALHGAGERGVVISLSRLGVARADGAPPPSPPGATLLRPHVHAENTAVVAALDGLLGGVVVVETLRDALELAFVASGTAIVTVEGDWLSASQWRIGASGERATRAALADAHGLLERAENGVRTARVARDAARQSHDEARDAAHGSHAALERTRAAVSRAEELLSANLGELALLAPEREELMGVLASARAEIDILVSREADAVSRLSELDRLESEKQAARTDAASARRDLEVRARSLGALRRDLEVRAAGLEERRSLLVTRETTLRDQIAERAQAHARAAARRSAHASEDFALGRLKLAADGVIERLERIVIDLGAERDRRASAVAQRLGQLSAVRAERDEKERELTVLRERRQRLEIDETEARVRHEAAVDRVRRELDAEPEEAMRTALPESALDIDPSQRLRELERELRILGPVNPLAREELSALTERNEFLEAQLEDVRSARRELTQVIRAIDAEIVEVFSSAYADVARHFEALIATLFPGGSGRLELTLPEDLLNTGVEIEARPAGRNVRRLSLLSGGERSLVAIAFLFAVFRSRPSPFYLLDEVEAALDEMNLIRFLELVEEFRDEAQLVIVSHQKKTMEVADALYGISMQPGGASKVVSELLERSWVRSVPSP